MLDDRLHPPCLERAFLESYDVLTQNVSPHIKAVGRSVTNIGRPGLGDGVFYKRAAWVDTSSRQLSSLLASPDGVF